MLRRFALFFAIWLILSEGAVTGLAPGFLAAAGAAWMSLSLVPRRGAGLVGLATLLPHFVWRSLVGGADVAWRALHPAMPMNPGWLTHPTRLEPGMARVALGSEVSLLPGTLVAGSRGDALHVHSLDATQDVAAVLSDEERRMAALFAQRAERADG